jgi:hypothetical protein
VELRFQLSGSVLFKVEADCVPPIGSIVRFRTHGYKKGLHSGSVISVPITNESPPEYDYTEGRLVVYLDANGYTVIEEGPAPSE